MRECPACSKDIDEGISYCPYCGFALSGTKRIKWYYRNHSLIIGFLMIGPLILPLIWTHPLYSRRTKLLITAVLAFITFVLMRALSWAFGNLSQYYKLYSDILGATY